MCRHLSIRAEGLDSAAQWLIAGEETQSDEWILWNPRVACQEGARAHTAAAHGKRVANPLLVTSGNFTYVDTGGIFADIAAKACTMPDGAAKLTDFRTRSGAISRTISQS
jgi:hypothetical protein